MWLAFVIAAAILGCVGLWIYWRRREYGALTPSLPAINALPLDVARRNALRFLRDEREFICVVQRDGGRRYPGQIPPLLKELFAEYESIDSYAADARLDRNLVGQSSLQPGYIRVGISMEATDLEFEIAVLPSDERIYELVGREPPDPVFGTYTTVFHWIIATSREGRVVRG